MTERLKAPVEPAVLAWGRKSAALSLAEAARKVGVAEARLKAWEAGTDAPTLPQLRKLAAAYKRPLAVFFLPNPPNELGFSALRDFRRLRPDQRQTFSPEVAYEIRAAQERGTVASGILEDLGSAPPAFDLTARVTDDPKTLARRVRDTLGITLAKQTAWRDPAEAFRAWRDAMEGAGVLVFVLGWGTPPSAP